MGPPACSGGGEEGAGCQALAARAHPRGTATHRVQDAGGLRPRDHAAARRVRSIEGLDEPLAQGLETRGAAAAAATASTRDRSSATTAGAHRSRASSGRGRDHWANGLRRWCDAMGWTSRRRWQPQPPVPRACQNSPQTMMPQPPVSRRVARSCGQRETCVAEKPLISPPLSYRTCTARGSAAMGRRSSVSTAPSLSDAMNCRGAAVQVPCAKDTGSRPCKNIFASLFLHTTFPTVVAPRVSFPPTRTPWPAAPGCPPCRTCGMRGRRPPTQSPR